MEKKREKLRKAKIESLPTIKEITCKKCGTILLYSQAEDRCPGCTRWGSNAK